MLAAQQTIRSTNEAAYRKFAKGIASRVTLHSTAEPADDLITTLKRSQCFQKLGNERQKGRTMAERRMYRIETKIPAEITPIAGGVPQEKFAVNILDISGTGCKVEYPADQTEYEQMIIDFKLDKNPYSVYCEVLRYNKAHGIAALSFTYPYSAPSNGVDPFEWLKQQITAYAIRNERYAEAKKA